MPPKAQTSKKAEAKAKAKIIEDKTFGLKNKNKSAKVGKYIAAVEKTVKQGGDRKAQKEAEDAKRERERRKEEEAKKAEMEKLFKPVVQQKVAVGVDPKTVICAYFKVGQCQKGDKCKFSHDLTVERKAAKINIYEDQRDAASAENSMEGWDQDKLQEVVTKKHGPGIKTTTDLVCHHFLEAIEQRKYGWFWECPNGNEKCKYRHALPPGFVLKSSLKKDEAGEGEEDKISLEEFLDTERHLIKGGTPVTAESFAKWKADRKAKQEASLREKERVKENDFKSGRMLNASGRDLFTFKPDMALADADGDDEAMDVDYTSRVYEGEGEMPVEDASLFLGEDLADLEISDEEPEEDN